MPRAGAFVSTLVLSLTIVGALPSARQQRQRFFAEAVMDGDFGRVRMLRFAGANINTRGNCCAPLYLAAGEGRLDVVRYLLDNGANVSAREKLGGTALNEAAYYGHLEVVKELLFRGAEVNAIGDDGTALDIATTRKFAEIAELLRHHGGRKACDLRKCG
ncbi:MAG TPA: ankyrin repeat domain-containing protein [Pyrinomonadaceae bacterium]|nr:ankyrin repeat domain-containing protein [Pyrinomonadaceae bacterium]